MIDKDKLLEDFNKDEDSPIEIDLRLANEIFSLAEAESSIFNHAVFNSILAAAMTYNESMCNGELDLNLPYVVEAENTEH